ncbi:hypothetical protein [Pseudothermotoga thermarum]|uniref:Uncharacterized protein n=1 Tax=Pseudothermotoga thermarum DSM 5069 TaxID=688269 RepID=F7YVW5_9THEM|nr:hypothetical protein [Pseudothermotoga thermarum]AEH51787.1 hypothetical protein Theth_1743 [Pseudothermotoga thermarum DSM 5069]
MSKDDVSRLLALIMVFSMLFVLDIITSNGVANFVWQIFRPLVSPVEKSRILAFKIAEGIKTALGKDLYETIQLQDHFSFTSAVVLGVRDWYIVVAAPSKPGDIAVDPASKKIVGITERCVGHISWVKSIFSPDLSIPVVVQSDQVILDGELVSGNRLRIYEEINVTGFEVFVSDVFTCGTVLKSLGYDFIGVVLGQKGKLFLVDNKFFVPNSVIFLPGY